MQHASEKLYLRDGVDQYKYGYDVLFVMTAVSKAARSRSGPAEHPLDLRF